MELQQIIMSVLGVACGILGWFARELYAAMQMLRRDLTALEVQITRDFIRYDRLQDALRPLVDGLNEIKHTLQGKADKP